jgi:hypothetical protein
MVPGLIKLSIPSVPGGKDQPCYINPMMLTFFTPSTESFVAGIGGNPEAVIPGATVILIGGLPLQVRESHKDIISAIVRLRDQAEDHILGFKKKLEKEDWMENGEEESGDPV